MLLIIQSSSLLTEDYKKEINNLQNLTLVDIVNYIKNSIDIIENFFLNEKIDEYNSNKNENAATDYETLLRKQEASIRMHIGYEHQIRIEYEKILDNLEIMELENQLTLYKMVRK